jgi:hypothetical protein
MRRGEGYGKEYWNLGGKVVEVCRIWESYLRTVGVVTIAGIAVAIMLALDYRFVVRVAEEAG